MREDSRVPPGGGDHGTQVPQAVRINQPMPRREVEQFQTHSQDNPRNDHTGPGRP